MSGRDEQCELPQEVWLLVTRFVDAARQLGEADLDLVDEALRQTMRSLPQDVVAAVLIAAQRIQLADAAP